MNKLLTIWVWALIITLSVVLWPLAAVAILIITLMAVMERKKWDTEE